MLLYSLLLVFVCCLIKCMSCVLVQTVLCFSSSDVDKNALMTSIVDFPLSKVKGIDIEKISK